MTNPGKLKELFSGLQAEMDGTLLKAKSFDHSGTKGVETENGWKRWFEDYLPERYRTFSGFVLDSNGAVSDQLDIIVCDRHYSPFFLKGGSSVYVPAESVYAAFEIKPTLDRGNIVYAGDKIVSARRLHRTSAPIVHAGGKFEPKTPFTILGGILTYDVGWNPPFGEPFTEAIAGSPKQGRIDLGCTMTQGSFEVKYEGTNPYIATKPKDNALVFFFMRLLARLQELGTVPAMNVAEYLRAIEEND